MRYQALAERRRTLRRDRNGGGAASITIRFPDGDQPETTATLTDLSDWGLGVETSEPLPVGKLAVASGQFFSASSALGRERQVRVVHCHTDCDGENVYRCGLAFEQYSTKETPKEESAGSREPLPEADSSFVDHYEALQISANADLDTIQRVYRMLAQRFHPDNSETGSEEAFRTVLQAYHVLSDPEKRAAYDVQHRASRTVRWKIFDQPKAAQGVQGERRTRDGILSVLYTKRLEQPSKPGLALRDLEDLLGCPREHLDFSLWYLRSKGLITSSDNARYEITADGVDSFQDAEIQRKESSSPLLLQAASSAPAPKLGNGTEER